MIRIALHRTPVRTATYLSNPNLFKSCFDCISERLHLQTRGFMFQSRRIAALSHNIDQSPVISLLNKDDELPPGLFLVSTPIGCLEDISFRALRVLRQADRILCEDTRHTSKLFAAYGIQPHSVESYHQHNEKTKTKHIIKHLVNGERIAVVSDAGTPAINDPGSILVSAAIEAGIDIIPVPGPCAPLAALVASGLPTTEFMFAGFVEPKSSGRKKQYSRLQNIEATLIFFASPHALIGALQDALNILGDRQMSAARELTKFHEEHYRGRISNVLEKYSNTEIKGEFTLVIEGYDKESNKNEVEDEELMAAVENAIKVGGESPSAAAKLVAEEYGVKRSRVYKLSLQIHNTKNIM